MEMGEGLYLYAKHGTLLPSDNVQDGEAGGSRIYGTLKVRSNFEVCLMEEEITQERVVWAVVICLVLRGAIDTLKLFDDCI